MKFLDWFINMILGYLCAFGLAVVIYNCIHTGSASSAIHSIMILGFGIGSIIFWNKK